VITPRQTRLVRVPHLHAFRLAILDIAVRDSHSEERPAVVVVPTRGAARQLRRLLERQTERGGSVDLATRDELYDRLHERLENPLRRLTAIEREVLMQRAAREASNAVPDLSFHVRPGLVAQMLRFYDHLRRQSQQVNRFDELMSDALGTSAEGDRGARRLRDQTTFLAAAFRDYEQSVRESGACDEHLLRDRLVAEGGADPIRRVIVTVPDWIADPNGLYVADFDLLARIPGLQTLDIVATDTTLATGFHERIRHWWPGIEEISAAAVTEGPVIVTPVDAPPDEPWWTLRDREEELVSIARQITEDRRQGADGSLDRRAVVFKTPLPYLYLAAEVLPAAGIQYQTSDALPLAVEPSAAALDLVLDAVASRFARNPLIALLASPHFAFLYGGAEISRDSISTLNRALSQRQYLGDVQRLQELAADWNAKHADAIPALQAALAVARELTPLADARPASEQISCLQAFWDGHLRIVTTEDAADAEGQSDREQRARAAIADTLGGLAAAHATHDNPDWTIEDLAVAIRRVIEDQTFEPHSSPIGVHLVDDQAARYGDFDVIAIVGVVEADWPERPRRNIFYPPALLKALGWPSERDRRAAADARFLELLASASRQTLVSTFTLEDDALVSRSSQLDEIPRARLSTLGRTIDTSVRVFYDEALSCEPVNLEPFHGSQRAWADLRISRSPTASPEFHGQVGRVGQVGQVGHVGQVGQVSGAGQVGVGQVGWVGQGDQSALPDSLDRDPRDPRDPRDLRDLPALTVSALETYLDCPFKFFAQHVLKLEDEPDDEEVMDPKRQGRFVHEVFEAFFNVWQASGQRAITPENLDRAREMFTAVVDRALEQLPGAEAGLERTRLLGSPAAAGLGEAVLRMEAERPIPVVERLLEHDLRGEFTFATRDGTRRVALRGKADRLDLLQDGTFRLIDYKLGWPPNRARALQLPIYGVCAEQRLARHRGRTWQLGEAVYLAFKGPRRVVPLFSSSGDRVKVLAAAQQRLVDTVDAIARADFPPAPDDVWRCETCSFSSVCRKDYVGDV
jgi:RecB family exonuclease